MLRKIGKITRVKGFDDLGGVFNDPDAGAAHFTLEIPQSALQQLKSITKRVLECISPLTPMSFFFILKNFSLTVQRAGLST